MSAKKQQKVKKVQKIVPSGSKSQRCVLVGTYKKEQNQLKWIGKRHLYNYPLAEEEAKAGPDGWGKVKELWLYSGSKDRRHIYTAEFVGIKSRKEFLADHPDYPKSKRPHGDFYAVFRIKFKYQPTIEDSVVLVRASDFKRTPKVAKAVKAYQAGGELGRLLDILPAELAPLSHDQLRVCEAAVQLEFLERLMPLRSIVDAVSHDSHENGYSVIDLFAGAGGLSFGFERVGFHIALAVEKDAWAVETYKRNHKSSDIVEGDIATLDDAFLSRYRGKIDVVMGGPPCQGFSIAASNRRKKDDSRNALYREFLRVVSIVSPKIVLIENVKEIVGYKLPDGTRIVADIVKFLKDEGYVLDYQVLDCKNYGVPQDRKRFFCLAVKKNLVGNTFTVSALMKDFMVQPISFYEAISDLPKVASREIPEGAVLSYTVDPKNAFQKLMRGGCNELHNHVPMRHTPKTVEKFVYLLKTGGQKEGMPAYLRPHVRGDVKQISNSSYSQNHRIIDKDKVSPTITASFYSSFIHPEQPRNLTVREAARLQTFPDGFIFLGKKTTLSKKLLARKGIAEELHLDQFNQVGNAVPPIMASHLATICENFLRGGTK